MSPSFFDSSSLLAALAGLLCTACALLAVFPAAAQSPPLPGLALDVGHSVGDPIQLENLAVYPIYAAAQRDLGQFETLEAALAAGTAELQELGSGNQPYERNVEIPSSSQPQAQQQRTAPQLANQDVQQVQQQYQQIQQVQRPIQLSSGGATVNTLQIRNKGERPILLLAGTVVKGGKQDRQIGQDLVIAPGEAVPVDAFCVERGRWNSNREGQETKGEFVATGMLATSSVRSAAQYESDQSKVWAEVAEVNKANKKQAATGTLMATVDDAQVQAQLTSATTALAAQLVALPQASQAVGLAYAVGDKVRGARWFVSQSIYQQHRQAMLRSMALEAATAHAAGQAQVEAPASSEVVQLVERLRRGQVEERDTAGLNDNRYRKSAAGYNAECQMTQGAEKVVVTTDFVAK